MTTASLCRPMSSTLKSYWLASQQVQFSLLLIVLLLCKCPAVVPLPGCEQIQVQICGFEKALLSLLKLFLRADLAFFENASIKQLENPGLVVPPTPPAHPLPATRPPPLAPCNTPPPPFWPHPAPTLCSPFMPIFPPCPPSSPFCPIQALPPMR